MPHVHRNDDHIATQESQTADDVTPRLLLELVELVRPISALAQMMLARSEAAPQAGAPVPQPKKGKPAPVVETSEEDEGSADI